MFLNNAAIIMNRALKFLYLIGQPDSMFADTFFFLVCGMWTIRVWINLSSSDVPLAGRALEGLVSRPMEQTFKEDFYGLR